MTTYDSKPSKIWLMLTNRCNIQCVYCYNKRRNDEDMGWDMVKKSIDFILMNSSPQANIMLWGGEPLIAWPIIKKLLDYYPQQMFGMSTNGTLITREIIDCIKKRGKFFTVLSIDGAKESQEKGRPNTWDLLKNVKWFTELENIQIHMVVYDVVNMYKNFRYIRDLGFKDIFITPAQGIKFTIEEQKIFEKELHKVVRDWIAGDFKSECWDVYKNRKSGTFKEKYCGAGVSMYAITTSGDIYPCDAFYGINAYKMGNITSGFDAETRKIFENIFYDRIKFKADCKQCTHEEACGGHMCIQQNYVQTGSIYTPISETCSMLQIEKRVVESYVKV